MKKTDLSQIRKVVREEVENESSSLKNDLGAEIKLSRIELQRELKTLRDKIKDLEIETRKIQKDTKLLVGFFDEEYLRLKGRVEIIEERLIKIPPI